MPDCEEEIAELEKRVVALETAHALSDALRGGFMAFVRTFGPVIVAAIAIVLNQLRQVPTPP